MNENDDDFDDDDQGRSDAPVGKNNPPREHQFKPGKSGNPKGRPPKPKPVKPSPDETTDEMILREAARQIAVGDKGETLSVHEVTIRATFVKAARGSPYAQRLALEMIEEAKDRKYQAAHKAVAGFLRRKDEGDAALAWAKQHNRPAPNPFPHPDDIYYDPRSNAIWIYGGLTPDEAAIRNSLRAGLSAMRAAVERARRHLKRHPEDTETADAIVSTQLELARFDGVDIDSPDYVGFLPREQVLPPPTREEYHALRRLSRLQEKAARATPVEPERLPQRRGKVKTPA